MKRIISVLCLLILAFLTQCASESGSDYLVTIKTSHGDMVAILHDQTPKHKANFIKLAKEHYFDSLLFHRVIPGFMIQGGDPDSKNAQPGQQLGMSGPGYTIESEFNPKFFHERGALSAARLPDEINESKASSGSQFYVVQGRIYQDEELNELEQSLIYTKKNYSLMRVISMPEYSNIRQQIIDRQKTSDVQWLNSFFVQCDTLIKKAIPEYKTFSFNSESKIVYKNSGGAPHLDGEYTVFGKVISGLEVIDKIAALPKAGERPMEDVRMIVTVEEMPKKKIEEKYGYKFPEVKK